MVNSIDRDLTFPTEFSSQCKSQRLPTLGTELWMVEISRGYKQVHYSFFKKPTLTRFGILQSSTMSWDLKRSSLSPEVIRRRMCIHIKVEMTKVV